MWRTLYAMVSVAFFAGLLLSFEGRALAYVDPGSGLFLLQSLSSVAVGALFFLRRRLRALLHRSQREITAPDSSAVEQAPGYAAYEADKAA